MVVLGLSSIPSFRRESLVCSVYTLANPNTTPTEPDTSMQLIVLPINDIKPILSAGIEHVKRTFGWHHVWIVVSPGNHGTWCRRPPSQVRCPPDVCSNRLSAN